MKQTLAALTVLILAQMASRNAAEAALPATRPNILFIFSDDHSLQSIGAHPLAGGHEVLAAPTARLPEFLGRLYPFVELRQFRDGETKQEPS